MTKRYTIRRFGLLSSFKVGCVWGALIVAIVGLCFVPWLFLSAWSTISALLRMNGVDVPADTTSTGGGLLGLIVVYLVLIVFYGLWFGVTTWFYALMYNLVARLIGGFEVELESAKGSTSSGSGRGTPPWLE